MPNELFIYDEIGPSAWGLIDGKVFAAALREIKDDSDLTVRINSPGGDVFEGLAIYELLKERAGETLVKVDSLAGSIASVIALAGDRIEIASTGYFAIHKPFSFFGGEAPDFRKVADRLDKIEDTAIGVYQEQVGERLTRDEISDMLAAETWMNAEESVDFGFADAVSGKSQADEEVAPNLGSGLVHFRKTPAVVLSMAVNLSADQRRRSAAEKVRRPIRAEIARRKIDLRRPPAIR